MPAVVTVSVKCKCFMSYFKENTDVLLPKCVIAIELLVAELPTGEIQVSERDFPKGLRLRSHREGRV